MTPASSLLSRPSPRARNSQTTRIHSARPKNSAPSSLFRSGNSMPHIFFRGNASTLPQPCSRLREEESATLDTPLPQNFPIPEPFIAVITQRSIEALLGRRPAQQLQTWFTPALYSRFVRQAALCAHTPVATCARYPARVYKVRCTHPRARVAEAAVIVHDGARIRAVAIRLEAHHGHWVVCALEIG